MREFKRPRWPVRPQLGLASLGLGVCVACGGTAASAANQHAAGSNGMTELGGPATGGASGANSAGVSADAGSSGAVAADVDLTGSWNVVAVATWDSGPSFCSQISFTLNVSPDGSTMTVGRDGQMLRAAFERTGDQFSFRAPFALPATADCGLSQIPISSFTLRARDEDGDGRADALEGSAASQFTPPLAVGGDIVVSYSVSLALSGVPDTTPPQLSLPTGAQNPFVGVRVTASEPLAADAELSLQGVPVAVLTPDPAGPAQGPVIAFVSTRILPLASSWQLSGSAHDLAGNALLLPSPASVSTVSDPGILAQDGFESGATAGLAGSVEVVSGRGTIPAISGARSLWIAPGSSVLAHLRRSAAEQSLHASLRAFFVANGTDATQTTVHLEAGVVGGVPSTFDFVLAPDPALPTGDPNWRLTTGVVETQAMLPDPGEDVLVYLSSTSFCLSPCSNAPPGLLLDDLLLE